MTEFGLEQKLFVSNLLHASFDLAVPVKDPVPYFFTHSSSISRDHEQMSSEQPFRKVS